MAVQQSYEGVHCKRILLAGSRIQREDRIKGVNAMEAHEPAANMRFQRLDGVVCVSVQKADG